VLSPIRVNFSLSENEMQKYRNQVASGLLIPPKHGRYQVEVVLVDGHLFPYRGRITFAAPSYNAQTGTFQLRADLPNPRGVLKPNQFVRARLQGAIRPNAVVVPQRAVQQGAKGRFVWVVNREGKAENRPVTVGEWHGDDWFITEGLRKGERVVVDGGLMLQSGAAVTVRPSGAPEQPARGGQGSALPAAARTGAR
jgi:membrane fusion protein, multidrug efflux system